MKVTVHLRGPLEKYGPGPGFFDLEAEEPCSIREILSQLGVPASAVAFVSVDGTKRGPDYHRLKGGERVVVYPQVAGG